MGCYARAHCHELDWSRNKKFGPAVMPPMYVAVFDSKSQDVPSPYVVPYDVVHRPQDFLPILRLSVSKTGILAVPVILTSGSFLSPVALNSNSPGTATSIHTSFSVASATGDFPQLSFHVWPGINDELATCLNQETLCGVLSVSPVTGIGLIMCLLSEAGQKVTSISLYNTFNLIDARSSS